MANEPMTPSKSLTLSDVDLKRAILEGAKSLGKLDGMHGSPKVEIHHDPDSRDPAQTTYRAIITVTPDVN